MADDGLPAVRADQLDTKRRTLGVFVRNGSGPVLMASVIASVALRVVIGGFAVGDAVVGVVVIVLVGPVEWVLHRCVLHARDDSWSSRRLGTGAGHQRHHHDPPDLEWLLLSRSDATIAVSLVGALAGAVVAAATRAFGWATWGPVLTCCALVTIAFAHYEWVHLLIHTRYRCRTSYYRSLAANHRRHHYRNERFWLGVTTNSGDRLLGTLPRSPVPVSATARTLDRGVQTPGS